MISLVESVREMREIIGRYKISGQTIGFVPTMGALHRGHLSLVEASLKECHTTVVSIFVNPTQFGPDEDLEAYPRQLRQDRQKLEEMGVDILFHPSPREMYPSNYATYVYQEDLLERLCGVSRPTHFQGVLTVVLKLFHIIQPTRAYFGRKDFQQSVVIRRMVRDFHMDVKIRVMPIVREKDGLAMSSRNQYLSPEERKKALVLSQSLQKAKDRVRRGEREAAVIKEEVGEMIDAMEGVEVDYVEIVEPNNLKAVDTVKKGHVLAVAAYVGKARLIDNAPLL